MAKDDNSLMLKLVDETGDLARQLSWKGCLVLAAILFIICYWIIPMLLSHFVQPDAAGRLKPAAGFYMVISQLMRMLGVVLGGLAILYAVINFFKRK